MKVRSIVYDTSMFMFEDDFGKSVLMTHEDRKWESGTRGMQCCIRPTPSVKHGHFDSSAFLEGERKTDTLISLLSQRERKTDTLIALLSKRGAKDGY